MKISNESKEKNTAFILLFGEPAAFNDGGGKCQGRNVTGGVLQRLQQQPPEPILGATAGFDCPF